MPKNRLTMEQAIDVLAATRPVVPVQEAPGIHIGPCHTLIINVGELLDDQVVANTPETRALVTEALAHDLKRYLCNVRALVDVPSADNWHEVETDRATFQRRERIPLNLTGVYAVRTADDTEAVGGYETIAEAVKAAERLSEGGAARGVYSMQDTDGTEVLQGIAVHGVYTFGAVSPSFPTMKGGEGTAR